VKEGFEKCIERKRRPHRRAVEESLVSLARLLGSFTQPVLASAENGETKYVRGK
jgi:hypothetical protein